MYKFYLDEVLLPVTPGTLTMKVDNKDETIDLMNGGTYTVLNPPGLTQYEFEFLLPANQLPFAQYQGSFRDPQYYINQLEKLKVSCKPFRFIITRNVSRDINNLNAYEDTNLEVSLDECTITESAGEYGMGKSVKVTLRQYKSYSTNRVSISGTNITVDDGIPRYAIVKEGTYISREGDTLRSIAFDKLGDEKYAEALALVQNPPLEFTLDPLPEFTVLQIDVAAIKAKYDEITVDPSDVDIWEPTTYIEGVQNGAITSTEYNQFKSLIEPICKPKTIKAIKSGFKGLNRSLRGTPTQEAPFDDQPPLIQFSYMIDGLLDAYVKAQSNTRSNEIKQMEDEYKSVQTQLASVREGIRGIENQIEEIEDSSDMDETLKANILETYEEILTKLKADEKTLVKEITDLGARKASLLKLPLGNAELSVGESDLEAMRDVLDGAKSDVVAAATITTWVQEIGILEAE